MDNGFSKWSPSHTKAQLATWSLSKIVIFQRKALHPQSKQMFLKFNFQILNWNKNQVQTTFWKKKCIRSDLWFLIKLRKEFSNYPFPLWDLCEECFNSHEDEEGRRSLLRERPLEGRRPSLGEEAEFLRWSWSSLEADVASSTRMVGLRPGGEADILGRKPKKWG